MNKRIIASLLVPLLVMQLVPMGLAAEAVAEDEAVELEASLAIAAASEDVSNFSSSPVSRQ